jgi:hypothetical protein
MPLQLADLPSKESYQRSIRITIKLEEELPIYKLGGKVKVYQQNYLKHILRMLTNQTPSKLSLI